MKDASELFITREELEKPRSPVQLLSWAERSLNRVCMTADGRNGLRFRKGYLKYLAEEAYPLGIFAYQHFGETENVQLSIIVGDQPYDALVFDDREQKAPFSFIEITQAHEGEGDHLRMIALTRAGHVSAFGRVKKHGNKRIGLTVEVEAKAMSHRSILERQICLIKRAIQKKATKQYPKSTLLLIVFDDYISVRNDDDIAAIRCDIESMVRNLHNFCRLSIVGWSKRTCIDFDLS